jgi:hypothetical protein
VSSSGSRRVIDATEHGFKPAFVNWRTPTDEVRLILQIIRELAGQRR